MRQICKLFLVEHVRQTPRNGIAMREIDRTGDSVSYVTKRTAHVLLINAVIFVSFQPVCAGCKRALHCRARRGFVARRRGDRRMIGATEGGVPQTRCTALLCLSQHRTVTFSVRRRTSEITSSVST